MHVHALCLHATVSGQIQTSDQCSPIRRILTQMPICMHSTQFIKKKNACNTRDMVFATTAQQVRVLWERNQFIWRLAVADLLVASFLDARSRVRLVACDCSANFARARALDRLRITTQLKVQETLCTRPSVNPCPWHYWTCAEFSFKPGARRNKRR